MIEVCDKSGSKESDKSIPKILKICPSIGSSIAASIGRKKGKQKKV
jgi:hypothetical protein